MNHKIFTLLGMTAPLMTACSARPADDQTRPNILFILVDDMGYGDMSCHGNPVFSTPNLDNLHDQSVRLTQFHVAPMSTPTRGQLMTGCEALRNGASWVGTCATHLRTDIPTLPEMLKTAGYSTAIFGKWHLGDNYPLRPQDRGFDYTLTYPQQEVGTVNDYWYNDYFDDTYIENGVRKEFKGFCTDVWFSEAIKWMEETRKGEQPFFCYLPTNVTHGPQFAQSEYREIVEKKCPGLSKLHTNFVSTVMNLDDNVGKMMDYLKDSGLDKNTIVIFMTDNGAAAGYGLHNAGMRGLKASLWEGGHRVPCFIKLPGTDPKEIVGLTQAEDICPTLLELCDVDAPEVRFDGISLAEQITGDAPVPDRILVNQFQRRAEVKKYDACVMWGPWRLLNGFDSDPMDSPERKKLYDLRKKEYQINLELYNVAEDPHQDHNLIDEYPEIAQKLKDYYDKWWDDIAFDPTNHGIIIVGSDEANPVDLCASSWTDIYLTQKSDILKGRRGAGYFDVNVARSGEYRVRLRRWPAETHAKLNEAVIVHYTDTFLYGESAEGIALDIRKAELKINDKIYQTNTSPDDEYAEFNVHIDKGPAKIKARFFDGERNPLCGAYYVEILHCSGKLQ